VCLSTYSQTVRITKPFMIGARFEGLNMRTRESPLLRTDRGEEARRKERTTEASYFEKFLFFVSPLREDMGKGVGQTGPSRVPGPSKSLGRLETRNVIRHRGWSKK